MPLTARLKPHTVTVDLPVAVIEANVLNGHSADPQGSVDGQMTPTDSQTMLSTFDVETDIGYILLCDPEHGPKFIEGGRVTWNGRTFAVKGKPLVFEVGSAADNAQVPLEEVD